MASWGVYFKLQRPFCPSASKSWIYFLTSIISVIKSGPSIRHIVFKAFGFLGFPAIRDTILPHLQTRPMRWLRLSTKISLHHPSCVNERRQRVIFLCEKILKSTHRKQTNKRQFSLRPGSCAWVLRCPCRLFRFHLQFLWRIILGLAIFIFYAFFTHLAQYTL